MSEQPDLQPGQMVAGKYEFIDELGRGGLGIVFAARDIVLGRRVALEVLLPDALKLVGAAERFLRKAKAAAQIKSEHVVDLYGWCHPTPTLWSDHTAGVVAAPWVTPEQRAAARTLLHALADVPAQRRALLHHGFRPASEDVPTKLPDPANPFFHAQPQGVRVDVGRAISPPPIALVRHYLEMLESAHGP